MKERSSNLEILRIVAMLIIIAHHYVVNSGIVQLYDYSNITANMIFLQFFGFGGKMAINIFVLISSYFMCQYKLTWKKVLKLYLEVKFYAYCFIYIIFCIIRIYVLSLRRIVRVLSIWLWCQCFVYGVFFGILYVDSIFKSDEKSTKERNAFEIMRYTVVYIYHYIHVFHNEWHLELHWMVCHALFYCIIYKNLSKQVYTKYKIWNDIDGGFIGADICQYFMCGFCWLQNCRFWTAVLYGGR